MISATRPEFFSCANGAPAPLPFSTPEYQRRLDRLRSIMADQDLEAVLFTSMHNISYYTGFLYCAFGRPYGCVVTQDKCVTISANIDGGQPGRRGFGENVIYTDWTRDNYWRAVLSVLPRTPRLGIEADHMTLASQRTCLAMLSPIDLIDISPEVMRNRMIKSAEEIELIRSGARIADIGGTAIYEAIQTGVSELEIAMAGRDAMERVIAEAHPNAEYRDTWVWFQSGLNTDGAHNPVTSRKVTPGDLLSLNTFPMISGYYTALERTLHLGEPDTATRKYWEANVKAHELGLDLIKPGVQCSTICEVINEFFRDEGLLEYRSFGYGHSFGILSHYYGREAGLELREDIDTVLEPGMVVSMEPMLWIPESMPGAGGYREHDILVVTDEGADNITGFPYGPAHNCIQV